MQSGLSSRRALVFGLLVVLAVVVLWGSLAPRVGTIQPDEEPQPAPRPAASPIPAARIPPTRSVSVVGTMVAASGDFKGSGRSQLALLQDRANDLSLTIAVSDANADGDTFSEAIWLTTGPGSFALARSRFAVADVTSDGKDDLVALYDDGDTRARLLVFRSTGTAFEFADPWWRSEDYAWSRARAIVGGAFSSSDRDGILVAYQYDNFRMRIHSFESTGSSFAYGGSQGVYDSGPGQFDTARARFAAGHFTRTGGPLQLGALYQYPNAQVRLHLFDPSPAGLTLIGNVFESGEGEYDLGRAEVSAGDVTGDGKDDLVALYGDPDGSARVQVFDAGSSFRPSNGWAGWVTLPAASICSGATAFVIGDWNGDRKADAEALAPAEAAKVRTHLLRNTGTGFKLTSAPGETACPRWPLTGMPLNGAIATRRPLYVKIDNNPTARPHYGISRADQVYEWLVEGMTTRLAAVFHSQEPGQIGSVRSARMTDAPIVPSLAGALVYSGAGPEELMRLHYDDAVAHRYIDLLPSYGWGYRAGFRPAPYNYFTTSQLLRSALAAAPRGDEPVNVPAWSFLSPTSSDPLAGGFASSVPASAITVPYRALFGVRYQYDPASRAYARFNDGVREIDGANGEAVAARNVLIIQTDVALTTQWGVDAAGSPKLDMRLVGTGNGILFRDGRRQEITWSRPDIFDVFALRNGAGEAVQFAPGQTWIHIVPSDWTIPSQ